MARQLNAGLFRIKFWAELCNNRLVLIATGNGDIGTRVAPTKSGDNDKIMGLRIDRGPKIDKDGIMYRRYYLQINKDAHDPTLKALAAKDPHAVWSYADVRMAEEPAKGVVADENIAKLLIDDKMTKFWIDLSNNMKKI
ncbi:hypothetical protein E4U25_004464 [Claviceps purpurea]|nr:hypothetical protein E4U25_004464 [Claviceps purpurea]